MSVEYQDPERLDLPSASQMEIVALCPGQPNLKAAIPAEALAKARSEKDDEWAETGTKIHEAFETGNTLPLTKEEHDTYQQGLAHQQAILEKWIHDKALDPAKVVEGPRELRVWLTKPYNFPALMGSAKLDRHWVYRDSEHCCLLVCDLKAGWNPNLPPSAKSWQLKFQLVALWKEEYDRVTDGRVAYVKAKNRCDLNDFCDYGEIDLRYSYDAIAYHSWFSTQPDAPRHAGKHCRWCPCKAWCPEAGALSMLPSVIADLAAPTSLSLKEEVDAMKPADLYKIFDLGPIIGKIIEAVKDRLKGMTPEALAELGLEVPEQGAKDDWISNVKGAFDYLVKEGTFSEEQLWTILEMSLAKLTKMRAQSTGEKETKEREYLHKLLGAFITREFKKPSIRYQR